MKGEGVVTESHTSYADGQERGPTFLASDLGEADLERRTLSPTSHILSNGKQSCIMYNVLGQTVKAAGYRRYLERESLITLGWPEEHPEVVDGAGLEDSGTRQHGREK